MMILSGRFIGFLPCHIGEHWAAQGQMRRLRPETYSFESQHFAAVRRADAGDPLVQSFLRELRQQATTPVGASSLETINRKGTTQLTSRRMGIRRAETAPRS